MSDLELDVPALHQLISVTQGDQDQSVLADTNQLRQQRLVDRDKHHHKQLWTKDPHGGQYRKTIEPGYEKPKSGPTTNFVGNHMTQGAIDLVQAELSPPADHSLLLLKDTPYQQPDLIAIECHGPIAPEHKTISKYTWWDNGDFIWSSAMSQSDLAQMTPVTAENGMVRGHGNEALLLQHRTSKFEDLKSEAEAHARRGAYEDAIVSYKTMLQRLGTVPNAEKAHIHCCLAGCLMQTGQLKLAVEECNGAVACAQGLADVSMVESALRLRAVVYEQLEAYHLSLQDFCCILQLQPGNKAAQQGRCRLTAVVKKLQS
ncbi:hypothetical protein WJX79_002344 [Trebouxia sp. C0005]